jgi:hypothetical protein
MDVRRLARFTLSYNIFRREQSTKCQMTSLKRPQNYRLMATSRSIFGQPLAQ